MALSLWHYMNLSKRLLESLDPAIIVEIAAAAATLLAPIISEIFALLREKGDKKDHRATVININNNWFHVENDEDSFIKQRVIELIEQHFKDEQEIQFLCSCCTEGKEFGPSRKIYEGIRGEGNYTCFPSILF
jgi:hypothetical protein